MLSLISKYKKLFVSIMYNLFSLKVIKNVNNWWMHWHNNNTLNPHKVDLIIFTISVVQESKIWTIKKIFKQFQFCNGGCRFYIVSWYTVMMKNPIAYSWIRLLVIQKFDNFRQALFTVPLSCGYFLWIQYDTISYWNVWFHLT